jgi:anti-sigma regulatory factor (Ser/Thr protein kinase)
MLFTDGLVERRDTAIDVGLRRMADVMEATRGLSAEAVADIVLREMAPPQGYDDDVAIVVYRDAHAPFRIELPAAAERLGEVRQQLSAWLRGVAVADELASDIVLVVNEATTNCVEHAFVGRAAGSMCVEARLVEGAIRVRVIDDGHWKQPSGDTRLRGRGIPMMDAISDSVFVQRAPTGTTIDMRFPLPADDAQGAAEADTPG